jgi:hypothetical protein
MKQNPSRAVSSQAGNVRCRPVFLQGRLGSTDQLNKFLI